MSHCVRARPEGCVCADEYGDNAECGVHVRCEVCHTTIGRVDWNTGLVNPFAKSCACGLELRGGVRGSIVRVLAYKFGQLALTDAPELTAEEGYTFMRGWRGGHEDD